MAAARRNLANLTARKLRKLLAGREISSVEMTRHFIRHIRELEPVVNAFTHICEEEALKQAERADDSLRGEGAEPGPLTGIPIMLKDNICTEGVPTTAASEMLRGFVPPYSATVAERVMEAGMVVVGKGNLDEFAMGSSNETSAFGAVHNPWNTERVPGGSSGGPAAAVAVGQVPLALGSDTGGSIRQPAALCSVVGMKPTYGLVSRYGLIAFGSSLDQIGPLARDVRDCADLMDVAAGYDRRDSTSVKRNFGSFGEKIGHDVAGITLGVPREFFERGDRQVVDAFEAAMDEMSSLGCELRDVSLPLFNYALAVYYIVAPAEASANLARFDGVKYGFSDSEGARDSRQAAVQTRTKGFGEEVKRRLFLGTYSLSLSQYDAFYKQALVAKQALASQLEDVFNGVDMLAMPTSLTTAFKIGERTQDPLAMYLSDLCTIPANVVGAPAISVPCGFAEELPVGLQFMAPHMRDQELLQVAHAYQETTDWHLQRPALQG